MKNRRMNEHPHLVQNMAKDVDPEAKATFQGFFNAISIVFFFWVFVFFIGWLL